MAIQANADQKIDISGAVPTFANAQTYRAKWAGMGKHPTPMRVVHPVDCERLSRFCVLMNLTCRARASLRNLGRRNVIKNLSPALPGQSAWDWQEMKPVVRQFTNRRMRTFIATPSARKVNRTEDPP